MTIIIYFFLKVSGGAGGDAHSIIVLISFSLSLSLSLYSVSLFLSLSVSLSLSISLSVSQLNIHQRVIVMHRWVPLVPNLHMRWNILRTRCVQKNNKKEIFITTWITSCVRWCMKPMLHIISKHLTGGTRSQHMSLHERKYAGKSCNRVDQLMCAMM